MDHLATRAGEEPTPAAFRDHVAGKTLSREARINISHRDRPGVWKMTVSLAERRILTKKHFPTARPAVQVEQLMDVRRVVKADARFIEACRKRGITDMTGVCVDAWTGGNFGFPDEAGRLISHTFAWLRMSDNENFYAHPIEGINAVVDIKTGEVLRVRAAMKPISTVPRALETIDVATGEPAKAINQRSDVTAVPAAGVVAEAMVALVLAEAATEKFGGDSVEELRRNAEGYLKSLVIS